MGRVTIAELENRLEQYKKINNYYEAEISRLNKELRAVKKHLDVVSCLEYNNLIKQYNDLENRHKLLKLLYENKRTKIN